MLSAFFETEIIKALKKKPTEQQSELIYELSKFVNDDNNSSVFLLKGYAGTGKTTIISALVKALKKNDIKTVLLAPTGRAAKVFSVTAKKAAYTIHKEIYKAKSKSVSAKFVLDKNYYKNAVFIVDEASMISNKSDRKSVFGSGRLLDDLMQYVFGGKKCKIIFSGDTAQLPPVGLEISPALDKNTLEIYARKVKEFQLTKVVRQNLDSGILYNATMLRKMIEEQKTGVFPKFNISDFDDIIPITGSDLIETISDSYSSDGLENTIVITKSNKRANRYNEGIRNAILYKEDVISSDDLVMIVKNNYYWKDEDYLLEFIANGDIAQIQSIDFVENLYGYDFANVELFLPDFRVLVYAKVFLNTLNYDGPALSYEDNKNLFDKISENYKNIKNKKKRFEKIFADENLNALQIKFAYAVTCHKAQGGQWNNIFLDQSYINKDMLNIDFLRWLYTAFTRAIDKIYLVNFKDQFF